MRNRFTSEQKLRWRPVDALTTVRIANASNRGADFSKCSKSDVYEGFETEGRNGNYVVNLPLFELRMDTAAKIIEKSKNQLRREIGEMLQATKSQP